MELYSEYFQAGTRGMQMSCLRCKVKQTLILNFVLVTTQQCTLYHTHLYLFLLLRSVNFVVLVVCSFLLLHSILCLEKAMAPHSSTLAWKIPWTEEPCGLQSMGPVSVRHNWATSLSLFTFILRIKKWQPTPVFLPGESQGQGSLLGCHLWGHKVRYDWSDLAAAAAAIRVKDWFLIRTVKFGLRHQGKTQVCKDKGRDWTYAATSWET